MIKIYVDYPGGSQMFEVASVPRVGETVYVKDLPYAVQEVKHRMADRYTDYGIVVILRTP